MNYIKLKNILKKYYSKAMVDSVLTERVKPSYKKMLLMKQNDGIPLEAWKNIRLWCGRDYYDKNGVLKSDRSRTVIKQTKGVKK